ncbi:hypothetical protein SC10_B2orf02318 [Bacillus paralicheniformis]|nr:hypothetical protein SC10_B2orf02318 [Bacillus paralicheniformis]
MTLPHLIKIPPIHFQQKKKPGLSMKTILPGFYPSVCI